MNSAKGISLNIPLSKDEIISEIEKVLLKNNMEDDVHIRLIISRGDKITPYQNPNANVGPINFVIIPEFKKTIRKFMKMELQLEESPTFRPSENILSTHYNTLSKLNCILASIEANQLKYDEGIMNDLTEILVLVILLIFFLLKIIQVWTSNW